MSERLRVALLDHALGERGEDGFADPPDRAPADPLARRLAVALVAAGHEVHLIAAGSETRRDLEDGVTVLRRRQFPDAPLRLRKIGDRPGRLPGTLRALAGGGYHLAHAFTPQDAAAAVLWSRATGRPAVFSVCEPLHRAGLADRRLRLATLRLALEHSAAVVAPDAEAAASLHRWMALEPRVIPPASAEAHLGLYAELRPS